MTSWTQVVDALVGMNSGQVEGVLNAAKSKREKADRAKGKKPIPAKEFEPLKKRAQTLLKGKTIKVPFTISGNVEVMVRWEEDWYPSIEINQVTFSKNSLGIQGRAESHLREAIEEQFYDFDAVSLTTRREGDRWAKAKKVHKTMAGQINDLYSKLVKLAEKYSWELDDLWDEMEK